MALNAKDPRGVAGGPSCVSSRGRDGQEDNRQRLNDQARRKILDGVRAALADIDVEDRADLLQWIASRGLLGLARERGFRAAAATAYSFADVLAGVGI